MNYKETADYIQRESGINVFKNTRQREYVEYRALYNYILYKMRGLSLAQVAQTYIDNGKSYNHATVIHSLKMFDVYKRYNHRLLPLLEKMCVELYGSIDNELAFIKNTLSDLPSTGVIQISDFIKQIIKKQEDENTKDIEVQAEAVEA